MTGSAARKATQATTGALVAAALVLTGCSTAGKAAITYPVAATTPPTASTSPAVTAASLGPVLEKMAIEAADLRPGYTLSLMGDGAAVRGQVTLDNCGFAFTSEAHRVARRQFLVLNPLGQDAGISNELVAYDSTADAAAALAQWRDAAARCPATPVHSSVAGVPLMRDKVIANVSGVADLPVPNNAVTIESQTAQGKTIFALALLQQRKRYLDIIWVLQGRAPNPADLAGAVKLASDTGWRLAAQD